jgi:hypothetical protein
MFFKGLKVFKVDFVEWESYVTQISETCEQKSTHLDLKVLKVSGHFQQDCNIYVRGLTIQENRHEHISKPESNPTHVF